MNRQFHRVGIALTLASTLVLASACTQGDQITRDTQPFDGISESETVTLTGTEPFWNFTIEGERAVYTSPDDLDGTAITLSRFAGNNGIGYSGDLNGETIAITVTPGDCSDGMSDRTFPFTATISLGERTLYGCGYTDSEPFAGQDAP